LHRTKAGWFSAFGGIHTTGFWGFSLPMPAFAGKTKPLDESPREFMTPCGDSALYCRRRLKRYRVHNYTTDELREALRPITSLISKSEKAQQKLAPGTWQHTMLRDNLKALHIASALMKKENDNTASFTRDDLQEALRAFASMISKTDKTQAKFTPGTSQHTLQANRLKALQIAETLIKAEFGKG
jgi:hypothetical protein